MGGTIMKKKIFATLAAVVALFLLATTAMADTPTGTATINNGASFTKTTGVTLVIDNLDLTATHYCASNTAATADKCTAWLPFPKTTPYKRAWALTSSDGPKTVYVYLENSIKEVGALAPVSITLDTHAPTNGTLSITATTAANTTFNLAWTGFGDALSGVTSYKLVSSTAGYPACSSTPLYTGTDTTFAHDNLVMGKTYYYRVCALDNAGNISTGAINTKKVVPEYDPPTGGSVVINGGTTTYTKSTTVTLTISATDASLPMQMCVSNSNTCTAWTAFAATKTWVLPATNGEKTVNVWFRDKYLNTTPMPVSASITLDTIRPTAGKIVLTQMAGNILKLEATGFVDAGSGIAGYWYCYADTKTKKYGAWVKLDKDFGATPIIGLTQGTTYAFKLHAVDNAGNASSTVVGQKEAIPEINSPSGSIVINEGAYTKSTKVHLTLGASDDTGMGKMCITNGITCSKGIPYVQSNSFPWTLTTKDGLKTVTVLYTDVWGNPSAYSADILLDTTPPTNVGLQAIVSANGNITLNWSDSVDIGSGLLEYRLVQNNKPIPASCTTGDAIYTGEANSYNTTLNPGVNYFRVCPADNAKNVASGTGLTIPTGAVPTNLVATGGDLHVLLLFTMSAITVKDYIVNVYANGVLTNITATGLKSPINIPGLTNGTPYTFTVTAVDSAGNRFTSAMSNAVTPTAPTPPVPHIQLPGVTMIDSNATDFCFTTIEGIAPNNVVNVVKYSLAGVFQYKTPVFTWPGITTGLAEMKCNADGTVSVIYVLEDPGSLHNGGQAGTITFVRLDTSGAKIPDSEKTIDRGFVRASTWNDSDNSFYLVYAYKSGFSGDVLAKVDQAGNLVDCQTLPSGMYGGAIAANQNGIFLVADEIAGTAIQGYADIYTLLWSDPYPNSLFGTQSFTAFSTAVYSGETLNITTKPQGIITKMATTNGAALWQNEYDGETFGYFVSDTDGNLYGNKTTGRKLFRLNADGSVGWEVPIAYVSAIALTSDGNVMVSDGNQLLIFDPTSGNQLK